MSDLLVKLKIKNLRSVGPFGGVIVYGSTSTGKPYVVRCTHKLIPDTDLVVEGQRWLVRGPVETRSFRRPNGEHGFEHQIEAVYVEILSPTGREIIREIANHPDCEGIGKAKATKLWNTYKEQLFEHIEQRRIKALTKVLKKTELAERLCVAFTKDGRNRTLSWLYQLGHKVEIPPELCRKIVDIYSGDARSRIEANPYELISFSRKWKKVDTLAQGTFGVATNDPRRLEGAVEHALYESYRNGHTCLPEQEVIKALKRLLGSSMLAKHALTLGESTQYAVLGGHYQPTGAFIIENMVAIRLREMAASEQIVFDGKTMARALNLYEVEHGYELTTKQSQAVVTSASATVSLIIGGAGAGKTAVLKALYSALEATQPDLSIWQVSLSGLAAQQMAESTGREAITIAAMLYKDKTEIGHGHLVVVDQLSMVDVNLMYRLLNRLSSGARLILMGDPYQLPPIGPGLILHALQGHPSIPQTTLQAVKRQSAENSIPKVATAVLSHQTPTWAKYKGKGSGVSFVHCAEHQLDATTEHIYAELGGDGSDYSVQILSIAKVGIGSVDNLNLALHNRYRQRAKPVLCCNLQPHDDPTHDIVMAATLQKMSIREGDLVMYTHNDYDADLRNGSLGQVIQALPVEDAESYCCIVDFEGASHRLKTKQLSSLAHAYCITVHKSQGSQFERVIVPLRRSKRLVDQALIYTAITRGLKQVVLVGDEEATLEAIRAPAKATMRHVTLPALLS